MRRLWRWLFGEIQIEWPERLVAAIPRYEKRDYPPGYRVKSGELVTPELFNSILARLDRLEK